MGTMAIIKRIGKYLWKIWGITRHFLSARGLLVWAGKWESVVAGITAATVFIWSAIKHLPGPITFTLSIMVFAGISVAWNAWRWQLQKPAKEANKQQLPSGDPSVPVLAISNGSNVTVPGYTFVSFEGVAVENTARAMRTLAACISSKITYVPASDKASITSKDMRQWVVWISGDPDQLETTNSPSIPSITNKYFTLILVTGFQNRKYYATFIPPRELDEWELDYGDWDVSIELRDTSGNFWQKTLKVELRMGRAPKWIDAFTSQAQSGGPSAKADGEDILFDSREGMYISDFWRKPGKHWRKDGQYGPAKGEGTVRVQDGVLTLERSNIDERYELWLERYLYKGTKYKKIPKDELISGVRQIRVMCEAKASCDHTLRFILRDFVPGALVDGNNVQITSNEWTPIDMNLSITPHHESQIAIFDQEVSEAPSSIQVRNLVVSQRK
jgi:hypothetical protein